MATNPVKPTTPAAHTPPHAEAHYDELSGVYGFFRRHQKKLLYTAGLFTLLTFSITPQMMSLAGELFGAVRPMATILVNGKRVPLTLEDEDYGKLLANYMYTAVPPGVMPYIDPGEGNQSQLGDAFAMLRRAAIEEGIGFSFHEVDRAIETRRELVKAPNAAKMASDMGFPSLARYRTVVAEAMRVGTYVKLQTLVLDSTEARVLEVVTSDREKITFHVATFDEKKLEDQLKAASTLTDDDLHKWLDGKNDRDKRMMQAYDPPLVELRFGALLLAEGQFDPEQWKDTYLKDYTVSDPELKNLYEQEKEHRFKLETDQQWKPFEDAAVKTELTRLAQAEKVMRDLMTALNGKQTELLKPHTDELVRVQSDLSNRQNTVQQAEQKLATQKEDLKKAQAALDAKPDDAALKEAATKAQEAITVTEGEIFNENQAIPAAKAAITVAEDALKAARAAFDFPAAFTELSKDKAGFVQKAMTGKKTAEELKDLDALGLELGKWASSVQGAGLREKGAMGFMPGRTTKAVILYQATDVEPTPLKPWDKLKPLAEGAYWTELAKKQGEEKKKLMEETLLRLAKAEMADKVAEIEGKKQSRIDTKLAEWETAVQNAITAAENTLKNKQPGTQMYVGWQQELDRKKAELARKDAQRTLFENEVAKAIETEIADEAKKHHGKVLDQAAAEAGWTVANVGPYARDLQQREQRFDKKYDATTVFLMRGHAKLKEGEATGVLQDFTNRRYHAAVCTKVEPLTPADVTRRDFESLRTGDGNADFASQQAMMAYRQSFTIQALEKRYELQRPVGEQSQVRN